MIKNQLIALIRSKVLDERPNLNNLYQEDERRLELDIDAAFNTIYYQTFKKSPYNLDRYVKTFTGIPVTEDTNGIFTSILPCRVIQFPTVGDGVRAIKSGPGLRFVPMKRDDMEMMAATETAIVSSMIGYCISSNIVTYYNMDSAISSVTMDVVPSFQAWLKTDDIPIPAGQDEILIDMIVRNFHIKPTEHLDNLNEV
jgi:hypothetical protein